MLNQVMFLITLEISWQQELSRILQVKNSLQVLDSHF